MRLRANRVPRHKPYLASACRAYSEHDGAKRQFAPSRGDRTTWYPRIRAIGTATLQRPQPFRPIRSLVPLGSGTPREPWPLSATDAERTRQVTFHLVEFQFRSLWARNDHHIHWRLDGACVLPEEFPHQALHAIAHHSSANFATRGHTQPRRPSVLAAQDQHDKRASDTPLTLRLYPKKIFAASQAQRFGKRACLYPRCWLGCLGGMVTVRRFRPFARRRLRTARPPGVAIRARKP